VHVLMLNHNVRGRSTYFRAMGLGKELVKRDHSVTLMTIAPRARRRARRTREHGVTIIETPDLLFGSLRTGWDPWDGLYRYRLGLALDSVDLVHAFDNRPAVILPALALSKKRRIPLCSDWADWWGRGGVISATRPWPVRFLFGGIETFFEEHFRTYADLLTVTSRALEQRALALGIPPKRVHYLPSGADTDRIFPMDKAVARRQLGLPEEGFLVEYMGYVQYDLTLALRAFGITRGRLPGVRFLLVGPGNRRVRRLVEDLGVKESVIVTGPQPHSTMSIWLAAADVLLLPFQDTVYNRGRGPIKLGDYLASGRPVVTNPVGEIAEILTQEGVALAAGEDPREFADKISLLLQDRELATHLGANARQLAEGPLNWRRFGGQLERLYRELLSVEVV
jgi:glycosyltransferase involved in cell wall biosynthesis